MKSLPLICVLVISLAIISQVQAERTSTRLTPANVQNQPVSFTIKVDWIKEKKKGECLRFHVTVKKKDAKFPLSPRRLAELTIFDGEAFISSCDIQPDGRGGEATYSFLVAAKYAEKSTFSFDEIFNSPVGIEGHYCWFYLKDFADKPAELGPSKEEVKKEAAKQDRAAFQREEAYTIRVKERGASEALMMARPELEKLWLPRNAVEVGESWKIDMRQIVNKLANHGALELDAAKSTGRGTLIKAYQKDGRQFGEMEFNMEMPVVTVEQKLTKFEAGTKLVLEATYNGCIDGTSEAGSPTLKTNITGFPFDPAPRDFKFMDIIKSRSANSLRTRLNVDVISVLSQEEQEKPQQARLIKDVKTGNYGLQLSKPAVDGLGIKRVQAEKAKDNTVQIPTNAVNEIKGEALVFVQPDTAKDEFFLIRVVVVQRFKDLTLVRSGELTSEEKKQSDVEVNKFKKRPVETLRPGERVVTRGVVELTAALEDLLAQNEQVPENKEAFTPEMRQSLAKIKKVHAGMKQEVIDAALDEFYKDLKRFEPKIFLPAAIGDLMRLAPKYSRTQKVLRDGLANRWLEPNLAHALLITAGDDPDPHIKALIENIGADDAKTRRAALDAIRVCAPNAQKALPILRKIIDAAQAPASDYQRAFGRTDDMPDHMLAYRAKTLIEAGRLNPNEIKEFVADPITPALSSHDFKHFKVARKDLEIILRDCYIEEEVHWRNGYSHVGGGDRTGHVILKDGKKVNWMVRPGGLAWLKFESGKKLYLLTNWTPYRMVLVQIKHDKDKAISVTIHSDEKKEQQSAVSVDEGAKVLGQMEGGGSRVGVYVTSDQGTQRADLKKLLEAISDNPSLKLEYFGREAPKVVVDRFLKAGVGPKPEPWAGEPVAPVKWVSGGKLSTFKRLPKADEVTALRITGEFNRTKVWLTAATFPAVLNSMQPVKANDPKYKELSYADWHAAEFETSEGRFRVNFYLGGLALLSAPDDSVGLVVFEQPK